MIARLHIGHSFITNSFLLKGQELPACIGCDELLTNEHILLTSSDLIEIRESHFTAQSLHVLFQEISPEKIFNFIIFIFFNQYFQKYFNFWLHLCITSLLSMVLKLYIYQF